LHRFVKGFLSLHRNAPPESNTEAWSRPEARIVAGYLILASAWIVGSDLLLTSTAFDQQEIAVIQSLKGLNFVITTALLLYFVLRRAFDGWRVAEARRRLVIEHARERFRALSSHVQDLREEDRIRIAREIHDVLGQLLTGIKMEVRMLENCLADRDDRTLNPAIDKLVEIAELVDDTIASVQGIASGLRPSALDNQGLGTALLDEAGQFSQRGGIPCSILVEDIPDNLRLETSTAVFRIFQEALTNVARHADARRVDSKLSVEGNALKLAIHDDGKGIDPTVLENPKSLGVIGMVERAESVGGRITFTPHPQKGTDVVLTVPL
jgi:signal transduction histidine kinase